MCIYNRIELKYRFPNNRTLYSMDLIRSETYIDSYLFKDNYDSEGDEYNERLLLLAKHIDPCNQFNYFDKQESNDNSIYKQIMNTVAPVFTSFKFNNINNNIGVERD